MGVVTEVSLPVPAELATNVVGVTSADPAQLDRDHLWHPFTQQQGWSEEEPLLIESGEGSYLVDVDGRRYLDGTSSLWCNVHGHRHPAIDRAVSEQLGRVAHSTMLGLSHPGAAELAARLVAIAPAGLSRVFYSDSGSTAAEIALKMAFQYQAQRGGEHARRTSFVKLREAYHGDTIGSVSVGGIDLFHAAYGPLLFETHAAEPGDAADLERVLATHGEVVAAVIVEPLVQGAAGILVQPPGYLRAVRELCDEHGVLLICDDGNRCLVGLAALWNQWRSLAAYLIHCAITLECRLDMAVFWLTSNTRCIYLTSSCYGL